MDESSLRDPSQARKRQIATAIFVLFSSISRQLCGSYKAVYSSVLQNSHWFMSTDFIAQHYSKTLDSKITHSELRNKKTCSVEHLQNFQALKTVWSLQVLQSCFQKLNMKSLLVGEISNWKDETGVWSKKQSLWRDSNKMEPSREILNVASSLLLLLLKEEKHVRR